VKIFEKGKSTCFDYSGHERKSNTFDYILGHPVERVESDFQSAHDVRTSSLNELWYGAEAKIKKVAATEWFDEQCATVNEEKNCARVRVIQIQNRTRAANLNLMNEYRQARRREKHLFRKKNGQLDDEALIEIERHHSVVSIGFRWVWF
jgi:hypothetical protein